MVILLLLGVGLVVSAAFLPRAHDFVKHPQRFVVIESVQFVFFLLGSVWVLWRRPSARWVLPVIVLAALGARLVLTTGTPYASSDLYRYVWDGKVQAHGINPYRFAPQDERAFVAPRQCDLSLHEPPLGADDLPAGGPVRLSPGSTWYTRTASTGRASRSACSTWVRSCSSPWR